MSKRVSLKELNEYRNKDGFIDLDSIDLGNGEIEPRGSDAKKKEWHALEDVHILVRENMFESEVGDSILYSELIIEELAKQVGMPCAHYDIAIKNGKKCTFTVNMAEKSSGLNLKALDDPKVAEPTDLSKIFKKVDEFCLGIEDESKVEKIKLSIRKMAIFDMFTLATDRHLGNISLLYGGGYVGLAPLYDNECSLMLDAPLEEQERAIEDLDELDTYASMQEQLIEVEKNGRMLDRTKTLIELIGDNPELLEFAIECSEMDVDKALDDVEERIDASVPDLVRNLAPMAVSSRQEELEDALDIVVEKFKAKAKNREVSNQGGRDDGREDL